MWSPWNCFVLSMYFPLAYTPQPMHELCSVWFVRHQRLWCESWKNGTESKTVSHWMEENMHLMSGYFCYPLFVFHFKVKIVFTITAARTDNMCILARLRLGHVHEPVLKRLLLPVNVFLNWFDIVLMGLRKDVHPHHNINMARSTVFIKSNVETQQ